MSFLHIIILKIICLLEYYTLTTMYFFYHLLRFFSIFHIKVDN